MSLYAYSFIEEAPSSAVTYFALLAIAQPATVVASERKGANVVALGVAATSVARFPSFMDPLPNPFSDDFSDDFGSGFIGGGTLIGKLLGAAGTAASHVATAAAAHAYPSVVSAASTSSSRASRAIGKAMQVATAAGWLLAIAHFRGIAQATTTGAVAQLARNPSRALHIITASVAQIARPLSRSLSLTSPSTAAINRGPRYLRGAISPRAFATVKRLGTILAGAHSTEVVHEVGFGKQINSTTSAESARTIKTAGLPRGNPSSQAVAAANLRALIRLTGATSAETTAAQRRSLVQRATSEANAAGLQKGPIKPLAAATAAAVALQKQAAKFLSGLSANLAQSRRLVAHLLFAALASTALLVTLGAHFSGALAAVQAQAAAVIRIRARGLALSAALASSAAAVRNLTHTVLQALSVAQGQTTAAAINATRTLLRVLSASQAQAGAMLRGMTHSLSTVSAMLAAGARAMDHTAAASIVQAPALTIKRFALTTYAVATSSVAAIARSMLWSRPLATPEVTVAVLQRGRALATIHGSTSLLRRLVGKLLPGARLQAASIVRLIGAQHLGTTTAQHAERSAPKGKGLGAVTTQVAALTSWFHFFVSEWAYQQTVLLPVGSGAAEPPAFGPIDPADRTIFGFNWAQRGDLNDPIVSAQVVSVPAGLGFFGPPFITGSLVEVTVTPFSPAQLPATYALRCTAVFASGRRSSFSIPVPVRTL